MKKYKDKYPSWFDQDGKYIEGSKENRIERIKDQIRDYTNLGLYSMDNSEIDLASLKKELAFLMGNQMTFDQRVVSRIRERYSIDDELAILRQRETKPQEYQEYFDYVEMVKAEER